QTGFGDPQPAGSSDLQGTAMAGPTQQYFLLVSRHTGTALKDARGIVANKLFPDEYSSPKKSGTCSKFR
ncbi:MAG TPA: hypothetical protein VGB56_10855, partial [Flavisolibacter sp.]